MQIGQLAKRLGISVETLRFYEKKGLIEPPARSPAGYRIYPNKTVQQLQFIVRTKRLGFSLKEIKELQTLQMAPNVTCGEIKAQTMVKIKDIEKKIAELERIKTQLSELASSCPGKGTTSGCPILVAFHDHEGDT